VIRIRTNQDVWLYTALATLFTSAVPLAVVAILLQFFLSASHSGDAVPMLTLTFLIPLLITPPIVLAILTLLKRLTLTVENVDRHVQFDLLTGALNRSHFLDRLRAARESGVLMIADLDHFKRINDEHGHDAGDQALIYFAALMTREVGQHGIVARLGGEEFAIFLPGQTLGQGKLMAQSLCLAACHARTVSDTPYLHPTVSLGGTLRFADEPIGISLKRADLALYAAKRSGRNRARFDDELGDVRTRTQHAA
jgi:diguanylate cyclase